MPATRRPSNSIIAAGISVILFGGLGALGNLAAVLLSSFPNFAPGAAYPDFLRPVLYFIGIFFLLCSLFLAAVGIQVIRLRNWARICLLLIAGCLLFFGLVGIIVIVVTLFVAASPDPLVSKALLALVLAVTYGIAVAISLWWLILFTRRSVVAQFRSPAAPDTAAPSASASRLNNPECPLAIRIIGWYLASFVFFLPFLPFIPGRLPAFFFGHVFHGPAAFVLFLLNFTLLFVPGFGLLLLKRWSYPLTIASQLLICANGIAATFSPAYAETLRDLLARMNLPGISPGAEQMLNYSRYFNLLSLLIPVAILVTLFIVRRDFFSGADRASGD